MGLEGILINNITKLYKSIDNKDFYALNNVNITICKGEIISIEGESGSGKSTLAKMLIGIEKPTSGNILINNDDITKWNYKIWRKHRKSIQAVFQDSSGTLNPARSTYHNVEESLVNLTDLDRNERKNKIISIMKKIGLKEELLKVPVRQLSGGEQRRLSLLRAMAVEPEYLILDEVTSGLDLISENMVLNMIRDYVNRSGCTCIFITHNRQSAMKISDKIAVMRKGKIKKIGTLIDNNLIEEVN